MSARPTKEMVKQALKLSGLTPHQFGALVYCSHFTVQEWLDGKSTMHPAFWELAGIKLKELVK